MNHDSHDPLFGGRRIYVVCLAIWLVAFLVLLPDIRGVGKFLHNLPFLQGDFFRKLEHLAGPARPMAATLSTPQESALISDPSSTTSSTSAQSSSFTPLTL